MVFEETFDIILDSVRAEIDPTGLAIPYYQFGALIEIMATVEQKMRIPAKRGTTFPMVALQTDFLESGVPEYDVNIPSIKVFIITNTKKEYKASQRLTNTFNATLIPIYEALIQEMLTSNLIEWSYEDHDIIRHYFWGTEGISGHEKNRFDNYIDAIEIRFKNIKHFKTC